MFDNPDLIPYFWERKSLKKVPLKSLEEEQDFNRKVIALADYHLAFFELIWTQREFLVTYFTDYSHIKSFDEGTFEETWDSTGWAKYIKQSFENSPILCELVQENKDFYQKNFVDTVLGYCPSKQITK